MGGSGHTANPSHHLRAFRRDPGLQPARAVIHQRMLATSDTLPAILTLTADESHDPCTSILPMYFLIYVSIATTPFSTGELVDLLEHARKNNLRAGVTGMLLYKNGNFMQVLEGEEKTVRALSAKIARDPRHQKMITLLEGTTEEREFSEWSMGFNNLDMPDASEIPGFTEFMNEDFLDEAFAKNPTRAQRLLRIFKRT